jgi:nucleolar protein 56
MLGYAMKATMIECPFGIVAFNEENNLITQVFFPRKPQLAAKALLKIELGKLTEEIRELIKILQKENYEEFVFENENLAKEAKQRLNVKVETLKHSPSGERLRSETERFAVETGFVKNAEEFRVWMHNVTMEIAKLRVKGAVEKRDLLVAQAILALDDLDRGINVFMSHVREWYGTHFPELDRLLDKHETYARLVIKLGSKDNFTVENLEKEDVPKQKAEAIAKVAEASMGADLDEADLAQIQAFCQNVSNLYELRQTLEAYLDKTMAEVAPNMQSLVGSLLGARLIAIAGGLLNLARKPASTIQILGAEKALFRSLKTGTRPPKHGIIFQYTVLHDAKRWQRGKISRALAGKLAIAARTDAFGGRDIGKFLKDDLEKRITEIQEKYKEPPPIQERKPKFKPQQENRWDRNRRKHRRER